MPDWTPRFHHEITLVATTGPLHLDVHFVLNQPWTVLFAPSGAGKTTILRLIAGLDRARQGKILCQIAEPVDQPAQREILLLDSASGIDVPPHRREIRMVAQRTALFPDRSVLRNILYSSASGEASRNSGGAHKIVPSEFMFAKPHPNRNAAGAYPNRLKEILELCRITHLQSKLPSELSGGERQRAVLAQALWPERCRLLLLDEPFTGIESSLRSELIHDLRLWLAERGIAVLMVTHDLAEVFSASAHVMRLEAGRIVAEGSAADVLGAERNLLIERLADCPGT